MAYKFNLKWPHLVAAVIILIAIVAVCVPLADKKDNAAPDQPDFTPSPFLTPVADGNADGSMNTVAYYQDDNGYLVPVMRTIGAEEGIARATLNLMVKSVYNDMEAARMGLRCVIPENTTFDLDISGGVARLDMSKEVMNSPDAVSEYNMVSAIVQTLTDFPTVNKVRFLVDGKQTERLTFGTGISGEFTRGFMNMESTDIKDAKSAVTLYFTGDSPSMIVPVTRAVYGKGDIQTAVMELVNGPSSTSPLNGVIPSGCGLRSVKVENGIAYVDFTREFISIAEETDGGRLALRALVLTCMQFDGVKSVKVLVEGEEYDTGTGTLAAPTFVNSSNDIQDAFIRAKTEEIFDFE
ncbi:MAG: GerMN domain-containing protein [Clostridia bacterium]|nr:GerMN domain-containing protein [Clostridia bacterium]